MTIMKAVILIGGPLKGTRFRPLSLDVPKPLFPVAGIPTIEHLIEACLAVEDLREVILIGFYQPSDSLTRFIASVYQTHKTPIRYLQEYKPLGTGGGIHHFRDQIKAGGCDSFIVVNADVCGDFPLQEMVDTHRHHVLQHGAVATIMGTEATRHQSVNYGCMAIRPSTSEVAHYVEKPSSFVSTIINCGVYIFESDIFQDFAAAFQRSTDVDSAFVPDGVSLGGGEYGAGVQESICLETDVIQPMAGTGRLFAFNITARFWSQIKSAASAIYANRHYLDLYKRTHPERLVSNAEGQAAIEGDVFVHPTAQVHPSAVLGPNVSVGANVVIGAGVRIRESIVLDNAVLQEHCCILYTIVGWNCTVGQWTRVEGTPTDPDPNKPFAKLDSLPLFTDGRLNPSITVLGCNVQVPAEIVILNSIVLPHKDLAMSFKNQIIL